MGCSNTEKKRIKNTLSGLTQNSKKKQGTDIKLSVADKVL